MNIAILSRGASLYSTQSLLKAGEARNHNMEILDPAYLTPAIEYGRSVMYYHNELIDDLHALIPRVGASNTYIGSSLVRHFQGMGVFCVVGAEPILQSRNKWTCFQILSKAGLPIPDTALGHSTDFDQLLDRFGGAPVIIKILQGTHGHGVILAETLASARSTVETLKASKVRFIVQEFIEESNGADLRAIVVDGKVVAAMKRQSREGEFRSNLHRGASSESLVLDHAQENIALRAARALRLGACGVDILMSDRGPLVLEVNSTPGLEGIEKTTGINVAAQFISYIERNNRG